jgi:hypothetical protein
MNHENLGKRQGRAGKNSSTILLQKAIYAVINISGSAFRTLFLLYNTT